MNICLFCASRTDVDDHYHKAAEEFGATIAQRGDVLYYGGGGIGLMGTAARAVHKHAGRVVGVIPAKLRKREVAYEDADELIVTVGMSDRKEILIRESDAFVILAGGFGTLDELLDVITTKQLGYHSKPIVIFNAAGFFDRQLQMFDHLVSERFASSSQLKLYDVCETVPAIFACLDAYKVGTFGNPQP
jgi:uncharacterized protein (TIGR00730 family)